MNSISSVAPKIAHPEPSIWPAAPALPGVTFRRTLGEADWPRMVDVINAAHLVDGIEEVFSLAEKANEFAHLDNCDPATDLVCVEVNGQLAAFGMVQWHDDTDGYRLYRPTIAVHPDVRSLNLMSHLYDFAEMRARQIAAMHDTERPKWLSHYAPMSARQQVVLLRDRGYAPVRYFYEMLHKLDPIPAAALPAGLVLRPVEKPAHLRAIFNAKEEAFADHWGHAYRTEADFQAWCENPTFEMALWQVAWDSATNEVAGASINTIFHTDNAQFGFKRGWVETLGVRRPWRGRGLAKALLSASLRALQAAGMTEVALGVDAANPTGALQLYENMGFRRHKEGAVWRKQIKQ